MLKTFSGRKASQNKFELNSFINFLKEKNVTRYLEIGARHGDTFHEVMINLPAGSYGLAVDLPGGLWGRSSTRVSLLAVVNDLRARGYRVDLILGDSTSSDVVDRVRGKAPFDAALIDGDHRYEGVKTDWENYRNLASVVGFHDIVGVGQFEKVYKNLVEVPRLWAEIKNDFLSDQLVEFVDVGSQMGIGVVCASR